MWSRSRPRDAAAEGRRYARMPRRARTPDWQSPGRSATHTLEHCLGQVREAFGRLGERSHLAPPPAAGPHRTATAAAAAGREEGEEGEAEAEAPLGAAEAAVEAAAEAAAAAAQETDEKARLLAIY